MQRDQSFKTFAVFLAAAIAGCAGKNMRTFQTTSGRHPSRYAQAFIAGYNNDDIIGRALFRADYDSVTVTAEVAGLKPNSLFAIHIREFGDCSSPDSSGGHLSQGQPHGNPYDTLSLHHNGDLPNLHVDAAGVGHMKFKTDAFALDRGGARSALGRSIVVDAGTDDYAGQLSLSFGPRIACGVIFPTASLDSVSDPKQLSAPLTAR